MPEFAIWDLLSAVVSVAPDRQAVLSAQGGVTFRELAARAERVASFLIAARVRLERRGGLAPARSGATAGRDHGLGLRAADRGHVRLLSSARRPLQHQLRYQRRELGRSDRRRPARGTCLSPKNWSR